MPPDDMRRSGRIAKEVAILLIGSDVDGKVFAEQTCTTALSRHGAGVVSKYRLAPEQEMIVYRVDTNEEAEVRIVGQIGSQSDRYLYGVAFLDAHVNFWSVEFPPPTESEEAASRCVLECSRCRYRETVDHSDMEWEVYAINHGIERYCERCGFSTNWKRVVDGNSDKLVLPSPEPAKEQAASGTLVAEPKTPTATTRPPNRRKHGRTKVSFTACIRRWPDWGFLYQRE